MAPNAVAEVGHSTFVPGGTTMTAATPHNIKILTTIGTNSRRKYVS